MTKRKRRAPAKGTLTTVSIRTKKGTVTFKAAPKKKATRKGGRK